MLDKIKSFHILKVCFLLLNNRRKYKLIKYTKHLQKKINLNLTNFMLYSGRYNVYLNNKLAREYDSNADELLFEGEYLNGERNGRGIEYFKGSYRKLSFKGEYKNGRRHGKGKEFDKKGRIIFEGEYLNGERNGKGKEYDIREDNSIYSYISFESNESKENYGKVIFEGEYLNGKRNGKGIEIDVNKGIRYEGEYLNGEKNGKGKEYNNDNNELIFKGKYLNNFRKKGKEYFKGRLEFKGEYLFNKKWDGKGYDEKGNVIYELKNGTGKVKEYDSYNNKLKFEGEYLNGKRNGKGKEYKSEFDGSLGFKGEYLNGKRHGKGKEFFSNGDLKSEREYFDGELKTKTQIINSLKDLLKYN